MGVYDDERIVLDNHRRQILDLSLGEVKPDSDFDPGDRLDRDGHFLASPEVPLSQEYVRHLMAIGVDDKAFNLPDIPVRGMDVLTAAYLDFTYGYRIVGDRPSRAPDLARLVSRVLPDLLEVRFFGWVEFVELGLGAVQTDPVRCNLGEVHRNEPVNMMPMRVLRADHKVGDRKVDWVNDHADHTTANSIGTTGAGPDGDRYLCHRPTSLLHG
jgi:hypothetical protein